MNELPESDLGWYIIEETWNLYIDGTLTKTAVYAIEVGEKANGDGYVVRHYDRRENLLTTVTVDADDILPEIRDRETTDYPWGL